jgi:hypothetical protein
LPLKTTGFSAIEREPEADKLVLTLFAWAFTRAWTETVSALIKVAILPMRFIRSWAEMLMTGAAVLPGASVWWPLMMGARVGGRERRSRKNSPTTADGAVRTGRGETTAAGCRKGEGGREGGEGEQGAILTVGFDMGKSCVFWCCLS